MVVIVGLGNPGATYDRTRHNIGFHVLDRLADRYRWVFKKERLLTAMVARGIYHGKHVVLMKPTTFMNESGKSVAKAIHYFGIDIQNLMVVSDDVEIPIGKLRLRQQGGTGGHNGLKSIRDHLKSSEYTRLRVGVGRDQGHSLSEYVLGQFSDGEWNEIQSVVTLANDTIDSWVSEGFTSATEKLTAQLAQKNNTSKEVTNLELTDDA